VRFEPTAFEERDEERRLQKLSVEADQKRAPPSAISNAPVPIGNAATHGQHVPDIMTSAAAIARAIFSSDTPPAPRPPKPSRVSEAQVQAWFDGLTTEEQARGWRELDAAARAALPGVIRKQIEHFWKNRPRGRRPNVPKQ